MLKGTFDPSSLKLRFTALFGVACFGLACLNSASPALAQSGPPAGQRDWPGGLPNGWRMLGEDEQVPGEGAPGGFDFGRDGQTVVPNFVPGFGQSLAPKIRPNSPPADPAKEAAAKARARAEALKKALEPKPEPAVLRQRALDELFKHLSAATDPDEAKGYADAIERIWSQSRSDTANLIMQRVGVAMQAKNYAVALSLLDRLVALEPDWAEAWNRRATVRFLTENADGAMADIDKTIKLEPRHFGALIGMGVILQRSGFDKRALEVYTKALEIYPAQPGLKETVDKLGIDVNGRDI